ncbi:MAG: hypothetical protein QW204_03780 [Thermoplasmata archaeon]
MEEYSCPYFLPPKEVVELVEVEERRTAVEHKLVFAVEAIDKLALKFVVEEYMVVVAALQGEEVQCIFFQC